MANDGRNRTIKSRKKIRTFGEKENYELIGIFESETVKQVEMNEKNFKRISQENEKTTRKQAILKKPRQSDKRPCKILGIILKGRRGKNFNKWTREQENS